MPKLPPWEDLVSGEDCPLCAPRSEPNEFIYFVARLRASSLYLSRNQASYGTCLLVFDPRHAVRLDQLSSAEWGQYASDLQNAETAIMWVTAADHVNVELLGNVVPHLHWHIIPRYRDEPRWGGPVWTTNLDEMPKRYLEDEGYLKLAARLRDALN